MFHAGNVGPWSRWRTNRRFAATCGVVDHVVAGNAYLAEIFQQCGCATSILPTTVDPQHYRVRTHRPTDAMRLVWIGSKSTIGYLDAILPALGEAAQRVPGLRLTIIADRSIDHAPLPIDFVPWSEAAEVEALAASDIGIAPTPTDRWTLGKCGFKIIQCMAAGLPVVASPVGANAVIVRDGETGYLASDPPAGDWTAMIARLAGDPELRATMGAAGRRDVWSIYTIERAADFWGNIDRAVIRSYSGGRRDQITAVMVLRDGLRFSERLNGIHRAAIAVGGVTLAAVITSVHGEWP